MYADVKGDVVNDLCYYTSIHLMKYNNLRGSMVCTWKCFDMEAYTNGALGNFQLYVSVTGNSAIIMQARHVTIH